MPSDFRLKLARARTHLDQWHALADDWMENHTRFHRDADFIVKASADPIPAEPFAVVLGDAIQNMRNTLDHIAYQLAAKYTNPLPEEMARDSQFPVVGDVSKKGANGKGPEMFKSQGNLIAGVHPSAKRVIETLQPFQRGPKFASHPLWKLTTLSNIDKHRVVHLVTTASMGVQFKVEKVPLPKTVPEIWRNLHVYSEGLVTQDTPIGKIEFQPGMEETGYLTWRPTFYISREDAVGEDVTKLLDDIYGYITTDVVPPLEPYL